MHTVKNNQLGFGAVELVLIVIVLALLGAVGWSVYQRQTTPSGTSTTTTNTTKPTTNTTDPTANWKKSAYVFNLPGGKGLGVVYMQLAGDADNLKTVEQAIQTIVING